VVAVVVAAGPHRDAARDWATSPSAGAASAMPSQDQGEGRSPEQGHPDQHRQREAGHRADRDHHAHRAVRERSVEVDHADAGTDTGQRAPEQVGHPEAGGGDQWCDHERQHEPDRLAGQRHRDAVGTA
jgi:hypothetical protein